MKLSYNWLKELLPDLKVTAEEVAEKLTMHAFETSVVGGFTIDPAIRVVKITKIEPHPNADRLRLATINDGQNELRVVCGAPNIAEGHVVAYAPPGAVVYDKDGSRFTIKNAVIRGEASPGMLASARELGLGADHGGIFILPPDTPLGSVLVDHIQNDLFLETEITPNRAHDSLSHIGVARELAALYNIEVDEPTLSALPEPTVEVDGFTIAIENAADTPRYMNVLVDGVKTSASPLWLQTRLLAAGLRPISLIVDITNYVLLEYGQPNHAFDAQKLPGKKTGVRAARPSEKIKLLDGQDIDIPVGALVITSDDTPVALAGIMGGAGTEVGDSTTTLLLEVANFRPFAIHHTATSLGLRTDSSVRFAKAISPDLAEVTSRRLVHLLQELAGATVQGVMDYYPTPQQPTKSIFSPERVSSMVGTTIAPQQAEQALKSLRFEVDTSGTPWQVVPPSDRLDITGEHDVVEEVVRISGLENIPLQTLTSPEKYPSQPPAPHIRHQIRQALVARGFTETYNVSFEPDELGQLFDPTTPRLEIMNPLAPEQAHLRVSLLPGLAANFILNKDDIHKPFTAQPRALFEVGEVFRPSPAGATRVAGVDEEEHIAGMLIGSAADAQAVLDGLWQSLGVTPDAKTVLFVGDVPPAVISHMKYRLPVAAFVIQASALYQQLRPISAEPATLADIAGRPSTHATFTAFSRYPSVLRDISFLVASGTAATQAHELIMRVGKGLVVDCELFDEFLPAKLAGLPPGKALAFHLEYQALDHTLNSQEVEEVHNRIITALQAELGAQLR